MSSKGSNTTAVVGTALALAVGVAYVWYRRSPQKRKRKRVAVLGGSFNPPTDGHLLMAANIIHTRSADEVWLVPCGPRPDKPSMTTCARDRLLLTHLAVEATFSSTFPIKVNDEEIERDRALTTPHLLSIYDTKYPDYDFSFVVGTDLLEGLHEWDDNYPGWELTRQLIVMDRPGYEPSSKWKNASNVKFLFSVEKDNCNNDNKNNSNSASLPPSQVVSSRSFIRMDISSSEVRNRILYKDDSLETALGDSSDMVQGLVPNAVLTLTEKIGMYRKSSLPQCSRCNTMSFCKCSATCSHHHRRRSTSITPAIKNDLPIAAAIDSKTDDTFNKEGTDIPTPRLERTNSFDMQKTGTLTVGAKDYTVSMIRRQRSSKLRVSLFGGSFDPVTSSHLKMAAEVVHTGVADEVWLVPCGMRSDKPDLLAAKDRYIMCQLAVTNTFTANFPIHVCDEEVYSSSLTTPELIKKLKNQFPDIEFSFILGSNLLSELKDWDQQNPKWWHGVPLVVVPRPGYPVSSAILVVTWITAFKHFLLNILYFFFP